ncbi:Na antiporter protein [Marine Group I thaumarchaeote SCGC AAA799-B03]|uniref:Na antiporter protein n=5 Tax=Marine Group I TaxID=905826 RepID=A0A087S6F3_9ARCH|nr:Na antiporter protein [Marine Group I thaumarchaeote SCGC AAA799-N04]KFM16625.1 Na antiporter protein [Marine Group I thaumarchaeote SCGC AAA799-D11]KFM18379.1 Na antiporter protein [Marine Group I thaumarchaeote SCGC AAA799-P11]KFM18678.1 Na antiporter protein [Marine Group I thaumarchaeote SCGC RSA3]KFM21307.1 Na antiporter protein [Marine Group I thaumarchaeote SCGC AAA799-B03]
MAAEAQFIETIIGVGILLFAAKLMAELFLRLKLPIVLGELLAGMIVGPFALGQFFIIDGKQLLHINEEIKILGEMGAIVILFMAGLEMTPKEFLKGGKASFTVGTLGVVVPFFAGFVIFGLFGFEALESMLIATALTATSIAISIQVLSEFGKLKAPEARLIIGAAVVDDILAIAVLSVVISITGSDAGIESIVITDVMITILQVLGFFAIMLVVAVIVIPKVITPRLWKAKGSVEGIATASFFGAAALAGSIGLSPIVGAFAVGMALSTTKVFEKVENYIGKIGLIFAPLFFAIIGAQVDLRAVDLNILMISGVIIAVAIVTKLLGCGLPAMFFLKNKAQGMRVGIGMISRGEVGLIVAGVGVTAGVLTSEVYSTIVIMVAVTTIITPIWLKMEYRKEQKSGNDEPEQSIEQKPE